MSNYHAEISLGLDGTGRVMIHDHTTGRSIDISSVVNAIDVHRTPGGRTTATLHLPWASVTHQRLPHGPGTFEDVPAKVTEELRRQATEVQPVASVETMPGCSHRDCVLDHPHAGPAVVSPGASAHSRRYLADTPEGSA